MDIDEFLDKELQTKKEGAEQEGVSGVAKVEKIEEKAIEEIKEEVDSLVGAPLDKPEFTNEVVGVVKWVDGTVIDSIFKVKK